MAQRHERMLRWTWRGSKTPERTLTEGQFICEVLELAQRSFVALPVEPMLIEGLDGGGQGVEWRAYVREPRDLLGLAHQLAVERCMRHESSGVAPAETWEP